MSKIDELLKNEKVEWKKLGEIAEIAGAGVDKKIVLGELPIKLLNYMDVYKNQYINSNIPTMNVTAPENKIQNCNIKFGDIFVTPSSETTDDIFRSGVATEDIFNTVYSYHIMRVRLKNKSFTTSCYLNYLFQSENFREKLYKRVFGNTRKTIAKSEIEQLQIPLPSIETQEKIVKTLDKFTNYVTELQAELQARTKQYDYYRDMLLSEEYLNKISAKINGLASKDYELKLTTLGEIGEIQMCKRILKEQTSSQGEVPFYKIGTFGKEADSFISQDLFREYREKYNYPKNGEILLSASGTIGKTVIFDGEDSYFQDSNIVWISHNERLVLNKYLYYLYQIVKWNPSTGGTINRLYNYNLKNIKITLPPIEIQNKVVEILDKFQSLLADTKGLLPQEIEQRQKQYEYYREKLLTFDENSAKRERESISL